MERAGKYTTFNRVRLALFIRLYACYCVIKHIRIKYKIDDNLTLKELKRNYFDKRAVPEISRLSQALNFNSRLLWQAIMLNKNLSLSKQIANREEIKIYLSIEKELVGLASSKRNRSCDFYDPDYENELAMLSIAIERATGNILNNIYDDSDFDRQLIDLQKVYLRNYYKVAYKYKLPTTRIVPFVLRLIS